jgi:hypothetical protein
VEIMPSKLFGISLLLGGVLLILLNVFLTPLMPTDEGEAVLRTSRVYLFRLATSGVVAILMLLGCVGIYLVQRNSAGAFNTIAFLAAFIGTSLIVGVEWSNVFVLRPVAQTYPEALSSLEQSSLMDIGFISAAGLFAIGWILISISAIMSKTFAYWIPATVIAGIVLIGILGATPLGLAGAIIGNAIFGLGLSAMGYKLTKV